MVQKTAHLILCFLAGHVFMVSASYNDCEPKEFARCNKVFTDTIRNADKNLNLRDIYCNAYEELLKCLTSDAECVGKIIDLFRFGILQTMILDSKLRICDTDLTLLRKLVHADEKYRMKIAGTKEIDPDHFQQCTDKTFIKCASRFAEEIRNGGKLCRALPNYYGCYESKTSACDEKIYKDFLMDIINVGAKLGDFAKKFPNVMPGC